MRLSAADRMAAWLELRRPAFESSGLWVPCGPMGRSRGAGCLWQSAGLQISVQGAVVALPNGKGTARASFALLILFSLAAPVCVRADIYKCTKAGAVSYQETPCEGANVQEAHIQDRDSDHLVGCFVSSNSRSSHYYEVRANGRLLNPLQLLTQQKPRDQ